MTSFKIQWKSGTEAFDPSRELASDPDASIIDEQSTSVGGRYAETITGLTNGTQYTVRVIATNSNGDSDPSGDASGTPQSHPVQEREFIENEVIELFESSHTWLRETWDHITTQNVDVDFTSGEGGWVLVDCPDHGLGSILGKCSGSSVGIGRADHRLIYIIVHEPAHIYTLANGVADAPGPLGVAFIYFYGLQTPKQQAFSDNDLTSSFSYCAPPELYADGLSLLALGDGIREELVYRTNCDLITDDVANEALAVVGSAATGEMPSCFNDTYGDTEGDPDLVGFWVDVKTLRERHRVTVVYQLRNAFGGYCNNWHATVSTFERGVTRNPWNDGGCVPDAPTAVSATAVGHGQLTVSWQGPLDDGGSPVEGYRVRWASGAQQYSHNRQVVVPDPAGLQATIAGLASGTSHTIQVLTYNHHGDGAEVTATPTAADTSAPSLLGAWLDPLSLSVHLAYNESLDATSAPQGTAFTLRVNGASQTTAFKIDGNVVTLSFTKKGGATPQDVLAVDYTAPTGPSANPLKDPAGNNVAALSAHAVRNDRISVALTSDPGADQTYAWHDGNGGQDVIEVTATFSEPVFVDGAPEIKMEIGDATKYAAYHSGSGTNALVFRYFLTEGEIDDDGIQISGGTIEGMIRYV